jgi:hypothetical protein
MSTQESRAARRAALEAAGAIDTPAAAVTFEGDLYQPTIPAKVRDAAYIAGLIVTGVVATTVPTVSAIWPDIAGVAAQIGTAVLSGVGLIVAGLGVVYRPGAQR